MARRATGGAPPVEVEQRELECTLSGPEWDMRSKELADTELEIIKIKSARKALTGQISQLSELRSKLAAVVESERETRQVICHWHQDWTAGTAVLRRTDTDEVVDQRTLTAEERQTGLSLVTDHAAAAAPTSAPTPTSKRGKSHEHANDLTTTP